MQINLELYRVFITVAEQGSFTGAAHALSLTQSAISQSIGQLEGLLHTRLFVRSAHGAKLTGDGHVLMDHIGGLLSGVHSAQRYFEQQSGLERGILKIGASDTLCKHLLLPKLKAYHEHFPGIQMQVTNRTSSETVQLLRDGQVDIGFVNLPVEGLSTFDVRKVYALHDCFVCGRRHMGEFSLPIAYENLSAYPLLMLERQSASRRHLDAYMRKQGVHLSPKIELGSLDLLTDFAENGLGIAAVVQEFLDERIADGRLAIVPLRRQIPARSVGMLTRKGIPPSASVRAFMQML